MSPTERRVQHAAIRGVDRPTLPSPVVLQALLEDALRTADAGDARRVVLLRRLQVAAPAQALRARGLHARLEHSLCDAVGAARHGSIASADAPAVWFADWDEAIGALIARWLAGDTAPHWPWSRVAALLAAAAPGTTPPQQAGTPLRRAAQGFAAWWHAAAHAGAAAAQPVRGVQRVAAARWLCARVQQAPAAVAPLLDEIARCMPALWPAAPTRPAAARPASTPTGARPSRACPAPPAAAATGPPAAAAAHWPTAWLAWRAAQQLTHPMPADFVLAAALVAAEQPALATATFADAVSSRLAALDVPAAPRTDTTRQQSTADDAPGAGAGDAPPGPQPHAAAPQHECARVVAADGLWCADAAELTAAGGIALLLNLLRQIGFAAWLDTLEPAHAAALASALLESALDAGADDPVWRAVPVTPADAAATTLPGLDLAAALPGAPIAGLRRAARRLSSPRPLAARDAARRWLALAACALHGSGLTRRTLVMRPARLAITDTHLDVVFALVAADLRVRRRGLDANPGWVPWFGRIVTLHFEAAR